MNRRIALPTALLTLSFALGAAAPAALADGPGSSPGPSTSFSNGYNPMSGATSGPPDRPSVDSGPAIVEPTESRASSGESASTVNAAAETEAASALPITATDLALLGGAAVLLLVIAELFRRSSSRGRGA